MLDVAKLMEDARAPEPDGTAASCLHAGECIRSILQDRCGQLMIQGKVRCKPLGLFAHQLTHVKVAEPLEPLQRGEAVPTNTIC